MLNVAACPPSGGLLDIFDWIGREAAIMRHVEETLMIEREMPSDEEAELLTQEYGRFAFFARSIGARPVPASGHVAAFWLLTLVHDGASLDEIATAAYAIKFAHDMQREYLDWAPIDAALDFAVEFAADFQAA